MSTVHMVAEASVTPNEAILSRRVIATLHKHYPGHEWGVKIEDAMLTINNRRFVGQWGYRINLLEHTDWALDKEVMRAGGQFLERFWQKRGKRDEDSIRELPRDARGHMLPDGVA